MSLSLKVLGKPGYDNCALVRIDSGQKIYRILLDCGGNCLWQVERSDLSQIDHVFFSHFHMDHICGFDFLFRLIYNRPVPTHFWGPEDTIRVLQARTTGYTWNLVKNNPNKSFFHEIHNNKMRTAEVLLREGFSKLHNVAEEDLVKTEVFNNKDFSVNCVSLDHKIECMAWSIKENPKLNIDPDKLLASGLRPGKWCASLKDNEDGEIEVDGKSHKIGMLRKKLLVESEGRHVGYVTDSIYNDKIAEKLISILKNADEVVMECAYLDSEADLAKKHHHMTVSQTASFALEANIKKLTLFHISDRYPPSVRNEILEKARSIFPETYFPDSWSN